jgi:hypothetical protein
MTCEEGCSTAGVRFDDSPETSEPVARCLPCAVAGMIDTTESTSKGEETVVVSVQNRADGTAIGGQRAATSELDEVLSLHHVAVGDSPVATTELEGVRSALFLTPTCT